jgi:hypothetical protein
MKPPIGPPRRIAALLAALTLLLVCGTASPAAAHVPDLPTDGRSLETATTIEDPAKSWVVYGEIEGADDVRYFRLDTEGLETLWISVMTPDTEGFTPAAALMGPDLTDPTLHQGTDGEGSAIVPSTKAPPLIDVPDGADVLNYRGARGEAEYEPFTPGAYYFPIEIQIDRPSAGPYYLAVHGEGGTGPFAVAVGREERFSPREWTALSIQLIGSVYPWSGQGWLRILLPGVLTALVGGAVSVRALLRQSRRPGLFGAAASMAGLLALSTAGVTAGQTVQALAQTGLVPAVTITLVLIALQAVVGIWLLRLGARAESPASRGDRIKVAALAVGSVLVWAGYLVGPAFAVIAALAPPYSGGTGEDHGDVPGATDAT